MDHPSTLNCDSLLERGITGHRWRLRLARIQSLHTILTMTQIPGGPHTIMKRVKCHQRRLEYYGKIPITKLKAIVHTESQLCTHIDMNRLCIGICRKSSFTKLPTNTALFDTLRPLADFVKILLEGGTYSEWDPEITVLATVDPNHAGFDVPRHAVCFG